MVIYLAVVVLLILVSGLIVYTSERRDQSWKESVNYWIKRDHMAERYSHDPMDFMG
jgi:hypothetical protein